MKLNLEKQISKGVYCGTLCWNCHNALNAERACCWADHLEPRMDWVAVPMTTVSGGNSYHVISCPGFYSDADFKAEEERKANEADKNKKLPDLRQPYNA